MKKVYKALIEVDGRLESLTTLGANLTYIEGQITYAPEGSMGIFVEDALLDAKQVGQGNKGYKKGELVVHEVTPLGSQIAIDYSKTFGDMIRYPAILLGKEVWADKPKEPTEVERLEEAKELFGGEIKRGVTCTSLRFCPEGRSYHLYAVKDGWVLYDGNAHRVATKSTLQEVAAFIEQDKPRPEPKFKVGDRVSPKVSFMGSEEFTIKRVLWADKNGAYDWPGHMHYHCGKPKKGCVLDHYWYDEDTLELAPPKEEWFDVTKECVVDIIPNVGTPLSYLGVFHEGNLLLRTGNKVTTFSECLDGYKVELLDDARFHYDCGGFKVLKKVVK